MKPRRYTQRRRARQQAQTRERIVRAAMAVHQEVGPRAATIRAIADRAGVQRLTVYRHFPEDVDLFAACTGQWRQENPPPEPAAWAGVSDPAARAEAALTALYRYYRRTARMWALAYRDRTEVPALEGPMAAFEAHLEGIGADLAAVWRPPEADAGAFAATLRHVLQFGTWASLEATGLEDKAIAGLATRWLAAIARAPAARLRDIGAA